MYKNIIIFLLSFFMLISSVSAYIILSNVSDNYAYEISFNGGNRGEIIEFTPKSDNKTTCIAISINNGGGISCFSKSKEAFEKENLPGG